MNDAIDTRTAIGWPAVSVTRSAKAFPATAELLAAVLELVLAAAVAGAAVSGAAHTVTCAALAFTSFSITFATVPALALDAKFCFHAVGVSNLELFQELVRSFILTNELPLKTDTSRRGYHHFRAWCFV